MIKPEKIKYYDGKPENGIIINWDRVRKYFRRLVSDPRFHNPLTQQPELYSYYIDMSDRSRGKTTNKLIVGLILFAMYRITTVYMRTKEDDVEPRNVNTLYKTILECGYIPAIFGEEYNGIEYRGYKWYLNQTDEDGRIERKCQDFCTISVTTDKAMRYKSRLVLPRGDFIIYDEFIEPDYSGRDMEYFQQNLKTILRDRKSGVIMMSANSIDLNSPWFFDFGIRKDVKDMKQGDTKKIDRGGTTFLIQILERDESEQKKHYNKKYLGFAGGKKYQSITGEGTWEIQQFPHIYKHWNILDRYTRQIYVSHLGDLLNFEIVNLEGIGIAALCRPATRTYPDSIIYTCGEIIDERYLFRCGDSKHPAGIIWKLYQQNRIFYATNECGELLRNFVRAAHKI